ncbi:MAG: 2-oxoglutarate dehydrogenase E1 component [Deltaproteobacteria bacterium]|nr:2-oxoglutarate dehydrogenase E1 component [Deltaproteobacteria bacterium]
MSAPTPALGNDSLAFVEALYADYVVDPHSVDEGWRRYFDALATEGGAPNGNGNGHSVQLGPSFGRYSIFNPASATGSNGRAAPAAVAATGAVVVRPEAQRRLGFFRSLDPFRDVPDAELLAIAERAEVKRFPAGAVIVEEGSAGGELYLLTHGKAEIRRGEQLVAELGSGEVVGGLSLFDPAPRKASARAKGEVELLYVSTATLLALFAAQPNVAAALLQGLSRRLKDSGTLQDRVDQLIRAYRVRGHLIVDLDPLGKSEELYPELNPAYYGFTPDDYDKVFSSTTFPGTSTMTLREMLDHLRRTYCRSIGVQFMHIDNIRIKSWLQTTMESTQNVRKLAVEEQIRILTKLTDAEIFEQFIHKKFIGAKRFSCEGAESLIPLLDMAIQAAGEYGLQEVVIGMAHRGRLNVLANIMDKSPRQIFHEFDDANPDRYLGRGDVKYHLGYSSDRVTTSGKKVHLSLAFNPSHLEFVNPVVAGRVRAKQDRHHDTERRQGMGIMIHGDAAFAGQGVTQETLNLSELHGYRTGGTLHVVVNNQIGFTTNPSEGRSTHYATDVAKMLQIPIIHVNGEHPEAVAQAIHLAMAFREEFQKDVVIDMYCYRRFGHNEGDEPAFTQPVLYQKIRARKSVREAYVENLLALGSLRQDQADRIVVERREHLEHELGVARDTNYQTIEISVGEGAWRTFQGGLDQDPDPDTGVNKEKLSELLLAQTRVPEGFTPHPKIEKLLESRARMARGEEPLDWGAAEALAFASLLDQGTRVRLSGQDSGRGTFSHRHAVLHDFQNGQRHVPLRNLSPNQGPFDVFNSPLSEVAVLGFEYGYSLDAPEALVLWEAQFGDFANVAQVIIDQFLVSGEEKWRRFSGLTLLLPHGFEGQGPEHSSARLERFLVAAAEDNLQVANLTTPAQLFHLLRRQVVRKLRKPLVVMSPKSLLRHPEVVSSLDDLAQGGFRRILPDPEPRMMPSGVRKILMCSGKVYYDLKKHRADTSAFDVALVRLEQYYPLQQPLLEEALRPFPAGTPLVWVQEEPRNMGAFNFLRYKLGDQALGRFPLSVVSRPESASPATGSNNAHKKEQAMLLEQAFRR